MDDKKYESYKQEINKIISNNIEDFTKFKEQQKINSKVIYSLIEKIKSDKTYEVFRPKLLSLLDTALACQNYSDNLKGSISSVFDDLKENSQTKKSVGKFEAYIYSMKRIDEKLNPNKLNSDKYTHFVGFNTIDHINELSDSIVFDVIELMKLIKENKKD